MAEANIVGKTEKETLLNEIRWLSDWSSKLLRNLKATYNVMVSCQNAYGPNFSPSNKLQEIADSISIQLAGACRNLRNQFDLGHYKEDPNEEVPVHEGLEMMFSRLIQQTNKEAPIPVDRSRKEPKLVGELRKDIRQEMKGYVTTLLDTRQKIQDILNCSYVNQGDLQPSLQIQLRIIGKNGEPIKVANELDVESIVTEIVEERYDANSESDDQSKQKEVEE